MNVVEAIIIYTNSTAIVENCIFYNNYSKGKSSASYSGGAIWSYNECLQKLLTAHLSNNNSDRPGDAGYTHTVLQIEDH